MKQPAMYLEIRQWLAKAKKGDATVDWSRMELYWKWLDEQSKECTDLSYLQALASLQSEFKAIVPPVSVFAQKAEKRVHQRLSQERDVKAL